MLRAVRPITINASCSAVTATTASSPSWYKQNIKQQQQKMDQISSSKSNISNSDQAWTLCCWNAFFLFHRSTALCCFPVAFVCFFSSFFCRDNFWLGAPATKGPHALSVALGACTNDDMKCIILIDRVPCRSVYLFLYFMFGCLRFFFACRYYYCSCCRCSIHCVYQPGFRVMLQNTRRKNWVKVLLVRMLAGWVCWQNSDNNKSVIRGCVTPWLFLGQWL